MKNWGMRLGLGLAAAAAALLTSGTAAFAAPAAESGPVPLEGPACAAGKLCVFDQPNFTGKRIDYYRCGTYDVRASGLAQVGSFINNQTGDQVATFSGPDPYPNGPVVARFTSTAVDARQDTTNPVIWVVEPC